MTSETIFNGNKAVIINQHESGSYWANLYVNARNGVDNADITAIHASRKSYDGIRKWAFKQLLAA